jgi:hypothetical protein
MNSQDKENLKELFEKFLNAKQAAKATEDIYKAEQILREHPAPGPDDMLITNIKAEIAAGLLRKQRNIYRTITYRVASVAAAILIVAAIGLNLLEKDKGNSSKKFISASIIPRAVWESDDIAADDIDLVTYTTEIEQIKSELNALQLGESDANGDEAVMELEMNLMEIESDFWKG